MAVGTILTLSPSNVILERKPVWPWPNPASYPRQLANGNRQLFFPIPYYNFPLRGILNEDHSPIRSR